MARSKPTRKKIAGQGTPKYITEFRSIIRDLREELKNLEETRKHLIGADSELNQLFMIAATRTVKLDSELTAKYGFDILPYDESPEAEYIRDEIRYQIFAAVKSKNHATTLIRDSASGPVSELYQLVNVLAPKLLNDNTLRGDKKRIKFIEFQTEIENRLPGIAEYGHGASIFTNLKQVTEDWANDESIRKHLQIDQAYKLYQATFKEFRDIQDETARREAVETFVTQFIEPVTEIMLNIWKGDTEKYQIRWLNETMETVVESFKTPEEKEEYRRLVNEEIDKIRQGTSDLYKDETVVH